MSYSSVGNCQDGVRRNGEEIVKLATYRSGAQNRVALVHGRDKWLFDLATASQRAGAGLALALACDIRIAAESAVMTTGYARIGLTGDYGIAWLLTRLVATSRARELMFLSERIDARRCQGAFLRNSVVIYDHNHLIWLCFLG
jgi:hypothetical protein